MTAQKKGDKNAMKNVAMPNEACFTNKNFYFFCSAGQHGCISAQGWIFLHLFLPQNA
jgi:hypothetical protein